jgi:DUF4097 and DUF4098 domain-containing protein YvlB
MRRHSFTGPLLLVIIGGLFLWHNVHPEAPIFDLVALYWPYALIAWGVLRLIEVVASRDGRYSGLSGGEIALVVLICMAGMGMFEVRRHGIRFTPAIFGEQYDYPVSVRGPAPGVKRIVIDNQRGTVHVTGADTQEVAVSGHKAIRSYSRNDADRTNQNTPVELIPQGDRLLVTSHLDRAPGDQRVADDLDITVPRGVAVEARGDSGFYEISDVQGAVELTSSRADVRLERVGGNVRLQIDRSGMISAQDVQGTVDIQGGRGSDVDLQNVAGQVTINGEYVGSLEFKNLAKPLRVEGARNTELRVEAVPGNISMDLGDFTAKNVVGPIRLITQSRDIKLEEFTESLELDTQRGDVELQPGRVPLPRIEAHSGVGEIELVLPEKASFQLQATAERGEAVNDFGPPIETQVAGRTATLKGSVGDGPVIRITADRGSVSVRKNGTPPSVQIPEPPKPSRPAPPAPPAAPVNLKDSETRL